MRISLISKSKLLAVLATKASVYSRTLFNSSFVSHPLARTEDVAGVIGSWNVARPQTFLMTDISILNYLSLKTFFENHVNVRCVTHKKKKYNLLDMMCARSWPLTVYKVHVYHF